MRCSALRTPGDDRPEPRRRLNGQPPPKFCNRFQIRRVSTWRMPTRSGRPVQSRCTKGNRPSVDHREPGALRQSPRVCSFSRRRGRVAKAARFPRRIRWRCREGPLLPLPRLRTAQLLLADGTQLARRLETGACRRPDLLRPRCPERRLNALVQRQPQPRCSQRPQAHVVHSHLTQTAWPHCA
jgi:hypothetical protein